MWTDMQFMAKNPIQLKVYQTLGGVLVPTTPYNKVSINFSFYFAEKLNMHINIYTNYPRIIMVMDPIYIH